MIRAGAQVWDVGQQPDLDTLAVHIRELTDGAVHLHQVDTGGNEYAVVLATAKLTGRQAAAVFDRWWTDAGNEDVFTINEGDLDG